MVTDPAALDPILVEIGAAMDRNRFGTFTSTHLALTAQLVDADRFLKDWQNYLIDRKADKKSECLFDLRRLSDFGDTFRPIPRTQLLQMYRDAQVDAGMAGR